MKRMTTMRPAFSMITAIFVIVIMASIGALVISISGKIAKTTTAQYQREQALLYAKSYTEYAIMAVTAHDRATTGNCVETIKGNIGNFNNGGYRIRTHIAYIGLNAEITMCSGTRQLSTNVQDAQTPLSIIIDAYVDYRDPDNASQIYTVHRRTIQKI